MLKDWGGIRWLLVVFRYFDQKLEIGYGRNLTKIRYLLDPHFWFGAKIT